MMDNKSPTDDVLAPKSPDAETKVEPDVCPTLKDVSPRRYSRDELLSIRCLPLCNKQLDAVFNNAVACGLWEPQNWRNDSENAAEQDDIVLSPQRRSFIAGCHIQAPTKRSSSPRDRPLRHVGSGRIVSWGTQDQSNSMVGRLQQVKKGDNSGSLTSRHFNIDKKEGGRVLKRRNTSRRKISNEEEPEWFSGGPLSRHETIELQGFKDSLVERDGENALKNLSPNLNKTQSTSITGNVRSTDTYKTTETQTDDTQISNNERPEIIPSPVSVQENPATQHSSAWYSTSSVGQGACNERLSPMQHSNDPSPLLNANKDEEPETSTNLRASLTEFSLEEFLSADALPDLLSSSRINIGSKFSRWFKPQSPVDQKKDEPVPTLSGLSGSEGMKPATLLLEMLHRGQPLGHIYSVEEVEATVNARNFSTQRNDKDDVTTFKNLLARMSSKPVTPPSDPQSVSVLQMLQKSWKVDNSGSETVANHDLRMSGQPARIKATPTSREMIDVHRLEMTSSVPTHLPKPKALSPAAVASLVSTQTRTSLVHSLGQQPALAPIHKTKVETSQRELNQEINRSAFLRVADVASKRTYLSPTFTPTVVLRKMAAEAKPLNEQTKSEHHKLVTHSIGAMPQPHLGAAQYVGPPRWTRPEHQGRVMEAHSAQYIPPVVDYRQHPSYLSHLSRQLSSRQSPVQEGYRRSPLNWTPAPSSVNVEQQHFNALLMSRLGQGAATLQNSLGAPHTKPSLRRIPGNYRNVPQQHQMLPPDQYNMLRPTWPN